LDLGTGKVKEEKTDEGRSAEERERGEVWGWCKGNTDTLNANRLGWNWNEKNRVLRSSWIDRYSRICCVQNREHVAPGAWGSSATTYSWTCTR